MPQITRRATIAALFAPAIARAQADDRPAITVAVQKISNTNTLDPMREQSSNVSERWMGLILENLIGRDQRASLARIPALATAWTRQNDHTVDLTLRPDVKLHNGDIFSAEDVAASFSAARMFGPAPGLPADIPAVARRYWPALDRVEVLDRHLVRFINRTPDPTMEGRLSAGGSQIISRRAWEEAGSWAENSRRATGSGPYRLVSFTPDREMLLDAHDAYWGGRPPLRRIRIVEVPEPAARVAGLRAGEYHLACDIAPDQISDIEAIPGLEVQGGLVPNHRILAFDKNHPILKDPRIRLAMAHAIDCQAIVDSLWAGRAKVPAGLQFDFYGQMLVPGWSVPAYDPARARALLRDAGYQGGEIIYRARNNYYTAEVATAQILVEFWRAVGLNIKLEIRENWAQVLDRAGPRGVRDWSNSATFDDPISSLVNQHGPNGAQQSNGEWTNFDMNTLSAEMETTADPARRRAIFARMLEICEREDPAYIVLHQNATFTAKRRDLPWRAPASFFLDLGPSGWGRFG